MVEKRILVTGGAGFIGSHLTGELLNTGNEVSVLDDFSVGAEENLKNFRKSPKLHVIQGDIRSIRLVSSLVNRVDVVYHLAVQSLGLSLRRPKFVHEVNDIGTLNLCLALRNQKLERFVYISSSEVYGTAQYVPMDERHPFLPTTPYGASKAAGEMYVRGFADVWHIPFVIVRPFNTYGPRARTDIYSAVIPNFIERVLKGEPPIIFGDGNQTRDFTYVADTVNGIIKAANSDVLLGDAVNIARGQEVSVNRIANIVLDLMDVKDRLEPVYKGPRPGDVKRHFADISKAKKLLDFKPTVSIEEGIKEYIKWRKSAY